MVSKQEETEVSENTPAEQEIELTKYELMLILMPELSQEQLDEKLKSIKKHIKEISGEIYHEDNWDIRDLSYQIKGKDKGYYVILYFNASETSGIFEFENTLKLDNAVIRHLLVKSPKSYEMKKLVDLDLSEEDLKKKATPRPRKAKFAPVKEKVEKEEEVVKEEVIKEEKQPKAEEKAVKKAEPEVKEEPKNEKPEEEKKVEEKEEKKKSLDISDLDSKLESILDSDLDLKI